jgi:glyoxylase-like metal-dependent hydrolase (beta-lactamase superfamily II)
MGTFAGSGCYVVKGERVYLVESGTQEVADLLLNSLPDLGVRPEEVAGVIATHIHLDHSGGMGWLVQQMPWLKVYVQENGAKHLINPSRLLASADVVYGGREEVIRMHGQILPVPESNVIPVDDAVIDEGSRLRVFSTPGHAPHHLLTFDESRGLAFVGELPGHYFPEGNLLYPALAPPSFNYEHTLNSLGKLKVLDAKMLCFSQFGFTDKVSDIIAKAVDQLNHLYRVMKEQYQNGTGVEESARLLLSEPRYQMLTKLPFRMEIDSLFVAAVVAFRQYFDRNGL